MRTVLLAHEDEHFEIPADRVRALIRELHGDPLTRTGDPAWTAAVVLDALLRDDVADEEFEFTSAETAELNDGIARLGGEAGGELVGLRRAILQSLRQAEDRLRER